MSINMKSHRKHIYEKLRYRTRQYISLYNTVSAAVDIACIANAARDRNPNRCRQSDSKD